MALDVTSFSAGLKVHYTDDMIRNMVYADNPFFGLIKKMEKFGGKNLPIPIIVTNPQGTSATFSTAQANKGNTRIRDFTLTRVNEYSLASISNEAIMASQGNADAFLEAAVVEIDGAIQACARRIAVGMYRNFGGAIGQVANSSFATTTLTLGTSTANDPSSVTNFEVGMVLSVASTDGTSGSVRSGTLTVAGVDRSAGTVTTSANLSTGIAAIAQNDYIFQQGDFGLKLSGLDSWMPQTVTSTAFFGLDRTIDSTRLGGVYHDGSAQPIEEALVDAAAKVAREGGRPTYAFVNYSNFANLEKALGSKVQYIKEGLKFGDAEIAFPGIQINGPKGAIKVLPDQNCQSNLGWMLDDRVWKLYSLGRAPMILDADGMRMLREASADNVEVRVGAYLQLGSQAPGWNSRIKLS